MISINSILQKLLRSENIEIIFTKGERSPSAFQLGTIPIEYDLDWLSYQRLYLETSGINVNVLDFFIIDKNQKVLAYFPLEYQDSMLSCGGGPLLTPLFNVEISDKVRTNIFKSIIRVLTSLQIQLGLVGTKLVVDIDDNFFEFNYQSVILSGLGQKHTTQFYLIIDLKKPELVLWSEIRKSYRNLINKSKKIWDTEIVTKDNYTNVLWDEFRLLHYEAAGQRYTRDLKTWNFQRNMVKNDRAFLSTIRDPATSKLIGCGLFQINEKTSIYATAAYDRALFSKPLGHLVQWKAILHMKLINLDRYYVGRYFTMSDNPKPTDKELSISQFKKGFTDRVALKIVVTF